MGEIFSEVVGLLNAFTSGKPFRGQVNISSSYGGGLAL